mgnify:CR=1 FL=1
MKKKKVIMIVSLIILVIIIIIISAILIIKKANNKETNLPDENNQNVEIFSNERVTKQEEVTNTVKAIVDSINSLNTYAKNNQKSTFTIRELQDIFQADITKFKELPYSCSIEGTFINFDESYQDYNIIMDCQEFYLD